MNAGQQFEEKRRMLERHQADAPTGVPTRFGEAEPEPEPPFGFREVRDSGRLTITRRSPRSSWSAAAGPTLEK